MGSIREPQSIVVGGASIHSSRCGGLFWAAAAAADSEAWRRDCRDDSRRAAVEAGGGAGEGPKSSEEEESESGVGAGGWVEGAEWVSSLSEREVVGRSVRDSGGERDRSVGAFGVLVVRKGMRGVSVWLGGGERLGWMRGGRGGGAFALGC